MTMNAALSAMRRRWGNRRKFDLRSPSDAPTWCLAVLGIGCLVETAMLGWVLTTNVPLYFEGGNEAGEPRLLGLALGVALLAIGLFAWVFGEILNVCRKELRRRLLGF